MAINCGVDEGYELSCDLGIGGVAKVYISRYNKDLAFTIGTTAPDLDVITAITIPPISPSSTSVPTFYTYEQDQNQAGFNFNPVISLDNSSLYYNHEVTIRLVGLNNDNRNKLKMLAKAPVSIIVEDAKGTLWFVGKSRAGRLSTSTAGAGKAAGDFSGMDLTFTVQEQEPPYVVDADVLPDVVVP